MKDALFNVPRRYVRHNRLVKTQKNNFSEKRQAYKTQFKLDYGEIVDKHEIASYCR